MSAGEVIASFGEGLGERPGAARSAARDAALSWLKSNYSNEPPPPPEPSTESDEQRKYREKLSTVLEMNVAHFVDHVGLENVGFLTLTFQENVEDKKEADRRFNSFATGVLGKHFGAWVKVCERQRRGAWHYHLLIDCRGDIRTGYNFARGQRKRSASEHLRTIWRTLGEKYKAYGFGFRSELEPVKSNAKGISKYVAKYLGKHFGSRRPEDKGKRLIAYSKAFPRPWRMGFMFLSIGSKLWRRKMAAVAQAAGCESMEDLQARFGCRWAYHLRPVIARWTFDWWDYDVTGGELAAECALLQKETGYKRLIEPAWEDDAGNEVRPAQFHGWLVGREWVEKFTEVQKIVQTEAYELLTDLLCRKRRRAA